MPVFDQLPGKSAAERAVIKADEHVRLRPVQVPPHVRDLRKIEVRSVVRIDPGGLEVTIRAWDLTDKRFGFGPLADAEFQRVRIWNPPIMVRHPGGSYVRERLDDDGTLFQTRYREDPAEALLQILDKVVRDTGVPDASVTLGRSTRTVDTFMPNAGSSGAPLDGDVARFVAAQTFDQIRNGAGTSAFMTGNSGGAPGIDSRSQATNEYKALQRIGLGFGTGSLIPSGVIIHSATLTLNGADTVLEELGSDDIAVVSFAPADEDSWAASDYANFGTTDLAGVINTGSWSATLDNVFTLNAAGRAHISTGSGNTHFGVILSWDRDDSFGGTWADGRTRVGFNLADFTGTADDPLLTVDHSVTPDLFGVETASQSFPVDVVNY